VSRNTVLGNARALVTLVETQQLPFMAAAVAYYAFVSVLPLLIVGLAVGTALAGPTVAAQALGAVEGVLTPESATVLETALTSAEGRGGVTFVGLLVLFWSSLRVFRGIDLAFARVYGIDTPKRILDQVRDASIAVAAITVAVGATALVGALVPLAWLPVDGLLGTVGLLVVLPVAFFPLYYVLPDCDLSVREALPGAALAGVGWTALGTVFGLYAARAATFQLYGVLGGVLLLLVWFYFGGLLVLLGAAVNAVLGRRVRDRQLQQGPLRDDIQRMGADGSTGDKRAEGEPGRGADESEPAAGPEGVGRADAVSREELQELRRELDRFEAEIEDRTVHRAELERDLKGYVRSRVRRGHAAGWGPYLVLLYGTAMTLGAFYLLEGVWAVLAMLVVWLSTLGLYALMVVVGVTVTAAGLPGRLLDKLREFR